MKKKLSLSVLFFALFIALIAFSVFQLVATLTDMILELLCGLDYQWEGERLIGELETLIAGEAAAPQTGTEADNSLTGG